MILSRPFILRPVATALLMVAIVLAGLIALRFLPVSALPQVDFPTIQVQVAYPGASPEVISQTVTAPLERQFGQMSGLKRMSSSSAAGISSMTLQFGLGVRLDVAEQEVQAAINAASALLPLDLPAPPTYAKINPADAPVLTLALTSDSMPLTEVQSIANTRLALKISQVSGVGLVSLSGGQKPAIRIQANTRALASAGLGLDSLRTAITSSNANTAKGTIDGPSRSYSINANDQLGSPEDYQRLIVAWKNGAPIRLADVATVVPAAENVRLAAWANLQPAVILNVQRQPGANVIDTVDAIQRRLPELQAALPSAIRVEVLSDRTAGIRASVEHVEMELFIAVALVVLVILIFLHNARATVIASLAVPISLIGTFAGLWMVGFSINTLTLFAMVLAIGIVVDDAIVVLENVERLMRENGMKPFEASLEAMREVSGAVVAIVLVLCAVFVPVAFLGGIAGALYRQFAVTVAIAVVISGFTALTLTPALCAIMMKAGAHHESKIFHPFNLAFERLTRLFLFFVGAAIRHRFISVVLFLGMVGGSAVMFMKVPGSFVPPEDQGYVFGSIQLPDGATLERTGKLADQAQKMVSGNPAVQYVLGIVGLDLIGGGNKTNAATMFVPLVDWADRTSSAQQVSGEIIRKGAGFREGLVLSFPPPAIRGLGTAGGLELYVQGRTNADPKALFAVTQDFLAALRADPRMTGVNSFFRPTTPQLKVEVNREKALALGVPITDVFDALQSTMGSLYVNDFNKFGRTYRVQVQADAAYRARPEDLGNVFVRASGSGEMIPLKALLQVSSLTGPEQIERFNGYVAAKVLAAGRPGVSSGEAIRIVEEIAAKTLPLGYQITWSGQAFQEKRTGSASALAFGLALVMVFLILAALYERWRLPWAVLLSVPFAVGGALTFVMLRGMENDIYFQIGLVVLIGLAAKNAILIVEFAQQSYLEGMTAVDAALKAARLRFRPIVMTSLAFVLGVTPLVFSSGAGAAARRSMGTGVFGGMLAATFIATIFVPLFFVMTASRRPPRDVEEQPAKPPPAAPAVNAPAAAEKPQ